MCSSPVTVFGRFLPASMCVAGPNGLQGFVVVAAQLRVVYAVVYGLSGGSPSCPQSLLLLVVTR
jgi:hypothetical protein